MGHAEGAVADAAADDDDLDVGVVIADVVADLLEAAQRREVRDRVGDRDVALHRDAAGDARHVLLGDADVVVPVRERIAERLDLAVADVRENHVDAGILFCKL